MPDIRVDGDKAVAVADFLPAQNDGQRISVGRVNDELVREPSLAYLQRGRIAVEELNTDGFAAA